MKTDLGVCLTCFLAAGPMLAETPAKGPQTSVGEVSDQVNRGLPRWLRFSGEERVRMEGLGGVGFASAENTYLLQRLRLNLEVSPVSWLKFSFQAQDSRVFFTNVSPAPPSQRNPADLRLGWVQIGNSETSPVTVRVGRQPLSFGEGRLVSDPNWSNVGRSFDAVRMTVHYGPFRLDAFTGASDRIGGAGLALPTPGQHFHGLYGSIANLVPNSTVEPYLLWKLEHNLKGELGGLGNLDRKTAGLRWVGKLPWRFDYGLETALQWGTQVNEPLSAWAGHAVLGYTLADKKHVPRFFAEFNRASGDQNPKDGTRGGFDPLFPGGHDKFGLADQFTWSNIVHARSGLQYKMAAALTISVAANSFWLANQRDGLYNSGCKLLIASTGTQGNHLGWEPDLQAKWTIMKGTVADLAYGHIFPGEFLNNTSHNFSYNSVYLAVTHSF